MIELRGLVKKFNTGSASETVAINHLNLTLQEGDFVTVIGGNGAGKSTLINIITGSIPADEGLILLNNNDVSGMKEYERAQYFGHVFQDPMVGTATDMTVIENLALAFGRGKPRSLFRWSYRKSDVEFFINQLYQAEGRRGKAEDSRQYPLHPQGSRGTRPLGHERVLCPHLRERRGGEESGRTLAG